MKKLNCRDLGFDCTGVIKANSEEEVLTQGIVHRFKTIPVLINLRINLINSFHNKIMVPSFHFLR